VPEIHRHSPLSQARFARPGYELKEIAGAAKIRVQALRARGLAAPVCRSDQLPHRPNTVSGEDPAALWKAPDDWIVYSPTRPAEALQEWVPQIESDVPLIATDVSSASVILELTGPAAIDVLLRDCTLDLEGDALLAGCCAQTQFAQVGVLLHRLADPERWRMFVERSVALHVWDWLVD
jgi:heterotetrameric sarcosine oxidase gamma subunit